MTHDQTSDGPAPGPALAANGRPDAPTRPGTAATVEDASERSRTLSPAALRALAEAEERRRAFDAQSVAAEAPVELGGRAGPDPVRYGDWEKGGIVSDF